MGAELSCKLHPLTLSESPCAAAAVHLICFAFFGEREGRGGEGR